MSLISIIIPVYNRSGTFREALSSALGQTYQNVEIIVIDDGSTYKSYIPYAMSETLRTHAYDAKVEQDVVAQQRLKGIQYFRQENKGAPAARNKGLELAKGDYVIFWDADVMAEPTMLESMVEVLKLDPHASFVYCNFSLGPFTSASKQMRAQNFNIDTLRLNNYIHTTSLIRRKDMIPWDETLRRFQDWDLWLSLAEQGKYGVWIDKKMFYIKWAGTISSWVPKMAYKKPWKYLPWIKSRVEKYEQAREVIRKKHGIVVD